MSDSTTEYKMNTWQFPTVDLPRNQEIFSTPKALTLLLQIVG